MGENTGNKSNNHHVFDLSMDPSLPQTDSKCFDDDGRLKRTGERKLPLVSGERTFG